MGGAKGKGKGKGKASGGKRGTTSGGGDAATGGNGSGGGGGGGGMDLFAGLATSVGVPVTTGGSAGGVAARDPFAQLGLAGMTTTGGGSGGGGEGLLRRPEVEGGPSHSQGAASDPFADLARVGAGGAGDSALKMK